MTTTSLRNIIYIHIHHIQRYKQIWKKKFFCYKCASFVPFNDGDDHMNMAHISETTLDTKKNSYMFFPRPFGNVYEVSWKSDHFLNSHHKWVNNDSPVEKKDGKSYPPMTVDFLKWDWRWPLEAFFVSKRNGNQPSWAFYRQLTYKTQGLVSLLDININNI